MLIVVFDQLEVDYALFECYKAMNVFLHSHKMRELIKGISLMSPYLKHDLDMVPELEIRQQSRFYISNEIYSFNSYPR